MKLFAIITASLLALVVIIWSVSVFWSRYQESGSFIIEKGAEQENTANENETDSNEISEDEDGNDIISEEDTTLYMEITRENCLNECRDFSEQHLKDYCLQACGFSVSEPSEDCSEKTGLQKDYCYKDLAIAANDFGTCEKISDRNIRDACILRLTENLLESSTTGI